MIAIRIAIFRELDNAWQGKKFAKMGEIRLSLDSDSLHMFAESPSYRLSYRDP